MISRKKFVYGFGDLKNAYYDQMTCFLEKCKFQNDVCGVYTHDFFNSWNSVTLLLGGHICQIISFGPMQRPTTLFCGKTSYVKMDFYEQKMTIKGMQFQKWVLSQDDSQWFRWRRRVYTSLYQTFLFLKFSYFAFANLWFLRTIAAPCITILRRNIICKNELLPQKNHWFLYVFSSTRF